MIPSIWSKAMLRAFLVMRCEGFDYITNLIDYLKNSRIIAHCCDFSIMKPLPSHLAYSASCKSIRCKRSCKSRQRNSFSFCSETMALFSAALMPRAIR